MQEIIDHYSSQIDFRAGARFRYLPRHHRVEYPAGVADSSQARTQLLHEVSHGLLDHSRESGLDHPTMEHDANVLARILAPAFNILAGDD